MSDHHEVYVYIYDLSQGMARAMSRQFLGKHIDGIWHTAIVVYGKEWAFGQGVSVFPQPGNTPYGTPVQRVLLGRTTVTEEAFRDFLGNIEHRFNDYSYDLLSNNCNNFSSEVARFLTGTDIPEHVRTLPTDVLNSPMGRMLAPMLQQFRNPMAGGAMPSVPPSAVTTPYPSTPVDPSLPPSSLLPVPDAPPPPPARAPHIFSSASLDTVLEKLRSFVDTGAAGDAVVVEESFYARLSERIRGNRLLEASDQRTLALLLEHLPLDKAFPALDLQRLVFLVPGNVDAFLTAHSKVLEHILASFAASSPPFRIMATRMLCNMFTSAHGAQYVRTSAFGTVMALLTEVLHNGTDMERRVCGALIYNIFAHRLLTGDDTEIAAIGALSNVLGDGGANLPAETVEKLLDALLTLLDGGGDAELNRTLWLTLEVSLDHLPQVPPVIERVEKLQRLVRAV